MKAFGKRTAFRLESWLYLSVGHWNALATQVLILFVIGITNCRACKIILALVSVISRLLRCISSVNISKVNLLLQVQLALKTEFPRGSEGGLALLCRKRKERAREPESERKQRSETWPFPPSASVRDPRPPFPPLLRSLPPSSVER